MAKYSGVIFDFNGTLFWDTALHNKAWNIFLNKYDLHFTDEEFFSQIHGRNNKDIFCSLFNAQLTDEQISEYIAEKEGLYQKLCLEGNLSLAPGAEDFLFFLQEKRIPFTIATASGKENVDFYFKHLGISKWFDYNQIVFNDGTIKGKPDPEIYQKAMQLIGLAPEESIVFEDAIAGLQSAKNANAGKIIVVNSNNDNYSDWKTYDIITNFDQIDRNLLKY